MADGMPMPGGQPPSPAPSPAGAAPPSTGTGASPAAMPVANRGNQAAGMPRIGNLVKLTEIARLAFPAGSDQWRDLGKALELMAKHVGPGDVSQGLMKTDLERLQMQQRQSAANTAMMRGMGGGGQPPAQPPQQPMPAG